MRHRGGRRASTFALTEARIGVAPAIISLTLLPKLSPRAAVWYYLTGETFTAQQAAEIGLVTITAEDVGAAVDAVTADLTKASLQGLAASKALTTESVLADSTATPPDWPRVGAAVRLRGAREGMLAFLEKRPPRWAT